MRSLLTMKLTSTMALLINLWAFSSWGWEVTQAAEPSQGSSFKELCQQQASLSVEAGRTVQVLLAEVDTNDCELAAENLSNRTKLILNEEEVSDLSPLSRLTNLKELVLSGNQITDVTPLAKLINLTRLSLGNNIITDVSSLAKLQNLESLSLSRNQITDVSSLAELQNLTGLDLSHNQITNVSPLAGLQNLHWLDLDSNQITNISPLAGLHNLHSKSQILALWQDYTTCTGLI